ncbi:hypothetical protein [Enterobacter sp. R1(2018)]|nr:hypothetical protein [Enterobacter sp. R1(2018)]
MTEKKTLGEKDALEEELDRLLDELKLTQEQREFIESMRQKKDDDNHHDE